MTHIIGLLSQLGTFLVVLAGVVSLLWKGTRHANRFVDSVQANTAATTKLTEGLDSVSTQTRDNTRQITTLTDATTNNTTAIVELGGRVSNLEETLK